MSVLAVPDIKRLGIFVFYNKAGKAEEYVDYLLASIRPYLSELFLVSNCELTYKTQKSFKKYTENIFIRENTGLDAAAYKKHFYIIAAWTYAANMMRLFYSTILFTAHLSPLIKFSLL